MTLTARVPAVGQVSRVSTAGFDAARATAMGRLATMVRGREMLGGSFRAALARHDAAPAEALAAWAEGAFTLANVNAGPGCLLLLFRMTAMAPAGPESLNRLAEAATAAAEICRKAGAGAARACLDARPTALARPTAAGQPEAAWWRGLVRLAQDAPWRRHGRSCGERAHHPCMRHRGVRSLRVGRVAGGRQDAGASGGLLPARRP